MATTQQSPVSLPTADELADATRALSSALAEFSSLRWRINMVTRWHGDRAPTFEDMGRLFSFKVEVDRQIDELHDYIGRLFGDLSRLDYVREHENVDPT